MALPDSVTRNEAAATRVLPDYYSAFSTLEVGAVLPYFNEPSLFISPQGVHAAPTSAVLADVFRAAMEGLRARRFGRSELSVRYVKSLGATATLVSGIALRYKLDGQELERVGVTYVLHRADTHWKIAVLVLHDSDEVAEHE